MKQARLDLGLTQRALGERVHLPQSHISKIEQGDVDLQLSSLTEMARALELEIQLVPRQALPAVEGVVRSLMPTARERSSMGVPAQIAILTKIADQIQSDHPDLPELPAYRQAIEALAHQRLGLASLRTLRRIATTAGKLAAPPYPSSDRRLAEGLLALSRSLRDLRNANAHPPEQTRQIPAHSLEDDEDD